MAAQSSPSPDAGPWRYGVDDFDLVAACHPGRDAGLEASFRSCLAAALGGQPHAPCLRWLDLGSGPGKLAVRLAEAADAMLRGRSGGPAKLEAVFVDNDVETCERLRVALARLSVDVPSSTTIKATHAEDAVGQDTEKGLRYQLVSALHLLYYVHDWLPFVAQMRNLARGGTVLVALKSGHTSFYELMKSLYRRYELELPRPFFGEEFLDLLQAEGLPHALTIRESPLVFPSESSELLRLVSFVWRLPPRVCEMRGCEIVSELRALAKETHGTVTFRDMHFSLPGNKALEGGGR